jgi:DNA-binding winged helix-turn-helix (wHTH) protein/TolB-like protein/Tfp pilus assembly protein PilF
LSKQTADILTTLLVHAGSLVTRQQLREVLWPEGEQVDYDKIINNGISRLRYIFKDDPQSPRFIERVPKRGYRLVVEVTRVEPVAESQPAEEPAGDREMVAPELDLIDEPRFEAPLEKPWRRPWLWVALAAVTLLVSGFSLWMNWRSMAPASAAPRQVSLAIAPFEASGTGSQELAESFRLDLADALSQLPEVQVRALHSVGQLHLADPSLPADAARLGLDMILFGHLSVDGKQCHLQFELVRGKDGAHVATLQYSGTVDQLASIRDQIQQDLFGKLQLAGVRSQRLFGSTSDPDAYRAYLQARYQFSQQTGESLRQATRDYDSAIERDPDFAMAYTGLARTYLILMLHELVPPQEAFSKAEVAVNKALELGASLAEVHSILGFIHYYRDWDFVRGEQEERQAVALEPHQPIYHQWLAIILCHEARYTEALEQVDLALADDPNWSSLYVTESYVAGDAQNGKRMLSAARRLNELQRDSPNAINTLANALWYSGRPLDAIAAWRRMAVLDGDQARVALEDRGRRAFLGGGVRAYARVRLEALRPSKAAALHPNDFDPAEWYMAAGEEDRVIEALRREAAAHDPEFPEMVVNPLFKKLHDRADFQAIVAGSGLHVAENSSNE